MQRLILNLKVFLLLEYFLSVIFILLAIFWVWPPVHNLKNKTYFIYIAGYPLNE
jgi:hypothetical protein